VRPWLLRYQLAHKQAGSYTNINVIFGADESHGWKAIQMPPVAPERRQVLRNSGANVADKGQYLKVFAQLAGTKQQEGWQPVKAGVPSKLVRHRLRSKSCFISLAKDRLMMHFSGRLGSVHMRSFSEFELSIA
jgi:hypothetical protein